MINLITIKDSVTSVFHFSFNRNDHFIGASPELLLDIKKGIITSMALAGTTSRGSNPDEDDLLAEKLLSDEKELHEHKLVIQQIIETLNHAN